MNGNWKLVSTEGVAAFAKSIGIPESKIADNKEFGDPNANVVETLSSDGNTVCLKVTVGGAVIRESKVPIGQEVEQQGLDGRPAKHTVSVSGNTMSRIQRGDGYECTYTRSVDGDNMTLVMTGPGGVTGTRKYVRA